MSAGIGSNKLKFTIYGWGSDMTLPNSGPGTIEEKYNINKGYSNILVDNTETYFWVAQTSGELATMEYCGKRRIDDLSIVSQSVVPNTRITRLFHPSNVSNNYGVAIQGGGSDFYVFDLTNDTLITSGTSSVTGFTNYQSDCILVGQKIYIVTRSYDRGDNQAILCIDLNVGTMVQTGTFNDASCGFVDNDTIYGFFGPEWFSGYRRNFGVDFTGIRQWQIIATEAGGAGFNSCVQEGMTANGYIWIPMIINGAWRFCKFQGDGTADFETPRPLKIIGEFEESPRFGNYYPPYYTDGRDRVAFYARSKLYVSDFETVRLLETGDWYPKAISSHYLFTSYGTKTRIYRYR